MIFQKYGYLKLEQKRKNKQTQFHINKNRLLKLQQINHKKIKNFPY
jgi:hypothetical protein